MIFSREVSGYGTLGLRALDLERDVPTVHSWVTRPYAKYWGMTEKTPEQVKAEYEKIVSPPHSQAYLGLHDGKPAFLVEWYEAAHDRIAGYYPVQSGDHGMHILVGPPEKRIHGFTWEVFRTVMEFMFSDARVKRVVVEPDERNDKIHALNRRAGFVYDQKLELPEKIGWLAFCTRQDFAAALGALEN